MCLPSYGQDVLQVIKEQDLITTAEERFEKLLNNTKYPVQIIWAGKPYPVDHPAISEFNQLVHLSKRYKNMAVLIGYELGLIKKNETGG